MDGAESADIEDEGDVTDSEGSVQDGDLAGDEDVDDV